MKLMFFLSLCFCPDQRSHFTQQSFWMDTLFSRPIHHTAGNIVPYCTWCSDYFCVLNTVGAKHLSSIQKCMQSFITAQIFHEDFQNIVPLKSKLLSVINLCFVQSIKVAIVVISEWKLNGKVISCQQRVRDSCTLKACEA